MLIQYTECIKTLKNLVKILKRNNKQLVFEMTKFDFFGCCWDMVHVPCIKASDKIFLTRMLAERIVIVD